MQREIGAVLAALDGLDAQEAAAAEAAAADADAAAAEPAALEFWDLAGPGDTGAAAAGQPPQRAQHAAGGPAHEAFASGAATPPEAMPGQARGGAAQRDLQRAVLRTRLADLESAQRRLQDGLEAQRAASAAEVRASGPRAHSGAPESAPAPSAAGGDKILDGGRATGASAGAVRRTEKPSAGTLATGGQATKPARAGAVGQGAAGAGGPGAASAVGAEATGPAPAPAPPAALEEGGLEAELDAAAKGGLVETERDRLIRLVRQGSLISNL